MALFCFKGYQHVNVKYKMNELVNKFLLEGDKFIPEMHLRQLVDLVRSGFTYIAGDPRYIYQNQLDKGCF